MAVYIVTGKLGGGKTLVTVGRIKDAIIQGRRIATNLDIDLKAMFHRKAKKIELLRVPDKPSIHDLTMIGRGYDGDYDENRFGALVLDECGTWFNSRNWNDKTRKDVNDWFLHARKLGWDVYLIIQDIELLDSQARKAIAEHTVFCRRLDRVRVPFISPVFKLITGYNIKLPRIHRAKVVYGTSLQDLLTDVWTYRGNDLFNTYDTAQAFLESYEHGVYSQLTPWHTHGRYAVEMTLENKMRLTKIYWKRFKSPVALATGILIGMALMFLKFANVEPKVVYQQATEAAAQKEKEQSPVIALVSKMYIVGSMHINGSYLYELIDSEDDKRLVTSKDLANMGAIVRPRSECAADVIYQNEIATVFCQ